MFSYISYFTCEFLFLETIVTFSKVGIVNDDFQNLRINI